jgi:hypothetical protein
MEEEYKIADEMSDDINFLSGNEVIMTISKEGFFWKGKRVEDVDKIYQRFGEWLGYVEKQDKKHE